MPADSYDAAVARGGAPGVTAASAHAVERNAAPVDRIPCAGGAGNGTAGGEPIGCETTGVEHADVGVTAPAPAFRT